ncbi:MAG TPA: EamA family transporter, partial [Rhizomicrobium sp.]|nr:EamA family transporter [Rhizomicrobium sp.]
MKPHLSWRDALLALAIVFVWGTNFVVIRLGLDALPPLFFATLRFLFVVLPAIFFLPRPRSVGVSQSDPKYVAWSNLAFYGMCIGLFQFGLLFIAMNGHIPPGLASLVIQMQVFFTIGLSMWRTGERIKPRQLAAFALAIAGMAVIAA